jgi:hypothetical protein
MPPRTQAFNYDAFISYKSEQESWAKRLAESLTDFGWTIWRDRNAAGGGIRAGERWSEEIRLGIRQSRRMIVLWSQQVAGDAASVVHQEVQELERLMSTEAARRFIPVLLDDAKLDRYRALAPVQAVSTFRPLHARFGDVQADQVSPLDWFGAMRPLIGALGLKDDVTEIRFVVAAMNRTQAAQIAADPKRYALDAAVFSRMRDAMAQTSQFSIDRYGDTPDDWRPFPQVDPPMSIRDLVMLYDDRRRQHARERGGRAPWIVVSYSEAIASADWNQRRMALDKLQSGPCLVVVDAVSLMHREVYDRLISQSSLHNLNESFIIGVAPYMAQMHADLFNITAEIDRELADRLQSAYDRFSAPFQPDFKTCVMNVDHELQFMRWLQVAGDLIFTAQRTPLRFQDATADLRVLRRMRDHATVRPGPELIDMSAAAGERRP